MAEVQATIHGEPMLQMPLDLYIPPDALRVFLETFQGPLDLLLYLIKKQNLDIFRTSIPNVYSEALKRIQKRGLARLDDGRLKPTQEGLYLNHKLILEFMNSSEFPHALSNL